MARPETIKAQKKAWSIRRRLRAGKTITNEQKAWLRAYNEKVKRRGYRPVVHVADGTGPDEVPSVSPAPEPTSPSTPPHEIPIPAPEEPATPGSTVPPPPPAPEIVPDEPPPQAGPQGVERPAVQQAAAIMQDYWWGLQLQCAQKGIIALPRNEITEGAARTGALALADWLLPASVANVNPRVIGIGFVAGAVVQNVLLKMQEDEEKKKDAPAPNGSPAPTPAPSSPPAGDPPPSPSEEFHAQSTDLLYEDPFPMAA